MFFSKQIITVLTICSSELRLSKLQKAVSIWAQKIQVSVAEDVELQRSSAVTVLLVPFIAATNVKCVLKP
ncbi:hypothetical protein HYALB_00012693 [Hymenoscyphus albidus]|uniref:Uncharacterized protein n=1 Tax=Hymenoscyphus albidus TaxID=595503 RepID=A0A9N9LZI5_9HELO|nr:hypothetical protein HYALB_00012693 [Hymenoscyphus albidus]